tara:strand:- start:201 stop:434 length:234 start_codon:yes stop_codon:yes gene_type:complete
MFQNRHVVENPTVLRRENLLENKFVYRVALVKGIYCRVIPSTWKEISYIKLLEKGVSYEVPSEGDGLFITFKSMPKK